jgi:DNA-binding MarR family transcriptional regulator
MICSTNDLESKLNAQRMTRDSSPEPEVAEFAGQLFFRLWRASHTQTADALKTIGLTPPLFAMLNYLRAHNGQNQQQIGSSMGIDPSTMVALVDQLEGAGLAERRPHPRDRRARAVTITAKGRRTLKRGRELAKGVEGDVLQGLTATERRQLVSLLGKAFAAAPPQPPWSSAEGD